MRSWLFVPGDSERKLQKAPQSNADVLIIDLEDAVAPDRKPVARATTAQWLAAREWPETTQVHVRVNALDTGQTLDDIAAILPAAPDGVMLPKCASAADVIALDSHLRVAEADAGLVDGTTKISVVATETATSLFGLGTYGNAGPRLCAMSWGAEDLAADLGAESNRTLEGSYGDPYRLARALCLAGARAAHVLAIDTVFTDYRDFDRLAAETEAARRDGFDGKLAIHPDQVPLINAIFTPSRQAIDDAKRIVSAFHKNPEAGVIALDGKMVDRPHLRQAERILARAGK